MIARVASLLGRLLGFAARRSVVVALLAGIGVGIWALWYDSEIAYVVDRFAGKVSEVKRTYVPLGTSPAAGDDRALVTVVVFADFHCGYCRKSAAVRRAIRKRYGDKVRWVYKHFSGRSPAARAGAFAADQRRFFELADRFFSSSTRLTKADIERHVARAGLDVDKLRVALREGRYDKTVRADTALGKRLGVRGTPSYFINGRNLKGHWPLPFFDLIVRQEMARARAALANGITREALYRVLCGGGDSKPAPIKAPAKRAAR